MNHSTLDQFLKRYQQHHTIQTIRDDLKKTEPSDLNRLIELYSDAIPVIEEQIWQYDLNADSFENYQKLFSELESLIENRDTEDSRHHFIIAIPVADRPQHLNSCLQSILDLCTRFNYGSIKNGCFNKISVLIADDSQHRKNVDINKEMCQQFKNKGLHTDYFGINEQQEIISQYKDNDLKNIIGDINKNHFYHKGASITRNITYLKLKQLQKNSKTLFYFIDSDQEFQITTQTDDGDKEFYAINYFYYLDRLFSSEDISILTGKVVGDPPVSPAVMAGNFIDDVIFFLSTISQLSPHAACQFHQTSKRNADDASYHDMADLFGFKLSAEAYAYNCPITDKHSHIECFNDFSAKLSQFFDGEHPTRRSYFQHKDILSSIKPARTIYTGNYIFTPENLKYFIPFANLKLRMAGPVLGRIIKSDTGKHFVSANLPMLHKRTLSSIRQSEFRPGVSHTSHHIDLSGELSRQFFGDVMLFSMIELTDRGYPGKLITKESISKIISKTVISMKNKYALKHNEIILKISKLEALLKNKALWWNKQNEIPPEIDNALQNFYTFIENMEFNFGKTAAIYKDINSDTICDSYHHKILDAITDYSHDMSIWQDIVS